MPAPIAHMLISRKARAALRAKAEAQKDEYPRLGAFLDEVQKGHAKVMDLGALGPDLACFQKLLVVIIESLFGRRSRPKSLEPWSYQMHSLDPNILPLKMFEIIWKESNPQNPQWEEDDRIKLAFLCGFLSHMAADHVIHPLVNKITGAYYKSGDNRELHQRCEVGQDMYLLSLANGGRLTWDDLKAQRISSWSGLGDSRRGVVGTMLASAVADVAMGLERTARLFGRDWDSYSGTMPTSFRYMLHKAMVEAYGVGPRQGQIVKWACGLRISLLMSGLLGPYKDNYRAMFEPTGEPKRQEAAYRTFVELKDVPDCLGHYDKYVERAVDLTVIYITALHRLYEHQELEDADRRWFRRVVRNADLSAPLDAELFHDAQNELKRWEQDDQATRKWSRTMALAGSVDASSLA